jgi:hypothetical protein
VSPFDPRLPIIATEARVKTCHVYHCWQAMKEMGRQFHAEAFATFAGLEMHHVEAILGAIEAHDALPAGRTGSTRGTRLPADFTPPQDWLDWASDERGWAPDEVQVEAENFRDFWVAKSGSGAAKLDWKATWRNWVRNSRRPNGEYRRSRGPMVSTAEHLERTAALYERMGRTTEAEDIRRRLAESANVLPFNRPVQKVANSGG